MAGSLQHFVQPLQFLGEPLYIDGRKEIDSTEVTRRLEKYYWPYHQQIEENIARLKKNLEKFVVGLPSNPAGCSHHSKRKISRFDFWEMPMYLRLSWLN